MLRIERIKIEILTEDGIYGTDQEIHTGLNFLSSNNNTCGKSSILEAIYYGLGFEEIIGGKGEKVLTSVYKSKLQTGENCLDVYESRIYLQIYNGKEHVTIYRAAKCQNRDSNLVTVYYDTMDKISETCQVEDKYVHLKNAALSERGYHYFLEKFLHLSLPEVPASDGTQRKLYLQLLFSSMFIEQKHGWADLFSGTPILGIKDVKKRIVEYVLNLDTIDNERKKEKLKIKEKDITYRWTTLIDELFTSCKVENCEIMNLPLKPQLLTAKDIEKIHIVKNGTSLNGFINSLDNQIGLLNSIKPKVVDNFDDLQEELEETEKNILNFEEDIAILRDSISKTKKAILSLSENIELIENDLRNNEDAAKLQKLGSKHNCLSAKNICPVCQQSISDSLIPQIDGIEYMSIEENIRHLNAQKKMLEFAKESRTQHLNETEYKYRFMNEKNTELRKLALIIRNDLYALDDNYSESIIYKKMKMQSEIDRLEILKDKLDNSKNSFKSLSNEWEKYLKEKTSLSKEKLTDSDKLKIEKLKECFINNLRCYGYKSVNDFKTINISNENYLPIIDNFDMKFDSSASDNIRGIWAYTLALLQVSYCLDGNHPTTIIFDEPVQHNIIPKDMEQFFQSILELGDRCQVIIGITIKDLDTKSVIEKLDNKKYHMISISGKAFQAQ